MTIFTRRKVLLDAIAYTALSAILRRSLSHAVAQELPENGVIIRDWIDQQQRSGRKAYGDVIVGRFADSMYFLLRPVTWEPSVDGRLPRVTVPVGFVTDFSSVPRVFWSAVRPDPILIFPAVLHDFLYWEQTTTRDKADEVFRVSMQEVDIAESTAKLIVTALRLYGQQVWERNARLRASGERRILRRFPDDPRVTWDEWKKRSDVFQ
ncbi:MULTISPECIES: DUF1353 domain-containing protein [Bradyrhizobium]|uniref:DUF1353 domain-containing protein n=1 Tax=Bradyrhizobium TaxID=374 RepID=UPI00155EF37F|nr:MULTISPECIES: DUF1353 domain-containing protein [Bradyrhizobium]MDD1522124.1 hypothetical protein [Bradyrhizobium sp. WBAH30]MDD1541448.1 hypothetical protein [Bradyrhizobium sp. WBAH41]MDD1556928.1 hypothetical protein [Bradyrhizobium sp. WBAH23]MDD1564729.1 hypothetical protein [Bradyrhizobium sp. WBAH33]MDD1589718.1 hypothetical protein [Bradyrhizobium sp. WBAH42]